jgi:hypothetical protein
VQYEVSLRSIFREIKRSLKRIFREIKRSLTFWHEINYPPPWVRKAYLKWLKSYERRHGNPYDVTKYFWGRNHIYKVFHETLGQGSIAEHWYVKKRIKK